MPLHKSRRNRSRGHEAATSSEDTRWLLADLEAAQRRNPYAAGHGDGRDHTPRHPLARLLAKRA
jgi:hypothetical protein